LTIGNFSNKIDKKEQYCYLDNIFLGKDAPRVAQKTKQKKAKNQKKITKTIAPIPKSFPTKEIFNPENIQFEHGRAILTKTAQAELDKLLVYLQQEISLSLQIAGHTDNSGTPTINQALAINRAVSVQQYLISRGVAAHRLKAIGFGASRPIADNDTVEGAQKNRRVEFELGK